MSMPPPPPPPPPPGYVPYSPGGAPVGNYASWGKRVGSYLLDAIVPGIPYWILAAVGQGIGGAGVVLTLLGIAWALYFFVRNVIAQGKTGQSFGKRIVGISLVSEKNGQPIGGGMVFGRYLLHFLDALPCYLGYLWPLWDKKRQTFADKILSTVVYDGAPTMEFVAAFKSVALPG